MKNQLMKLFLIGLIFLINPNRISAQAKGGPLDGNKYNLDVKRTRGPEGGFQMTNEYFVFKKGKMLPKELAGHEGFKWAPYSITYSGSGANQIIEFSYFRKNKWGSKLNITGKVQGTKIEGNMEWNCNLGLKQYSFVGSLVE